MKGAVYTRGTHLEPISSHLAQDPVRSHRCCAIAHDDPPFPWKQTRRSLIDEADRTDTPPGPKSGPPPAGSGQAPPSRGDRGSGDPLVPLGVTRGSNLRFGGPAGARLIRTSGCVGTNNQKPRTFQKTRHTLICCGPVRSHLPIRKPREDGVSLTTASR
ncbi:unnamed protein product [Arctogadus glacialis]